MTKRNEKRLSNLEGHKNIATIILIILDYDIFFPLEIYFNHIACLQMENLRTEELCLY